MPTVLIDADGCPVVDVTIRLCKSRGVPVLILCDTAHRIERNGAETLVFDKGADSADLKLISLAEAGDLIVTQDFGVAAMALGKGTKALNQNGLIYSADNIDQLLFERFLGKKVRRSGGRTKNMKKRSAGDDAAFERALRQLLDTEE